jgi:hypothetical protein
MELGADIVELAPYVPPAPAPLREIAYRRDAWSADQVETLRRLFEADEPIAEIAAALGRPFQGVRHKIYELALRRNSQRPWSELEDAELAQRYGSETAATIAQDLGRGVCAVYSRAALLGLSEPSALPWTEWELAQLRAGFSSGVPVAQIAVLIGRPVSGVRDKAHNLSLRHATTPPDWSEDEVGRMVELAHQGVRYLRIIEMLVSEGFPRRTLSALKGQLWKTGYGRGWGRPWNPDEDELLRRAYQDGASLTPLLERLGRTKTSMAHRASFLGIRGTHARPNGFRQGPDWTEAEEARLRETYGKVRPKEIAAELGRPIRAIYSRANRLGLVDRAVFSELDKRAVAIACRHQLRLKDVAVALRRPYGGLSKYAAKQGLSFADTRHQRPARPDLTLEQILELEPS